MEEEKEIDSNHLVLARVDERTKSIQLEISHLREEIKTSTSELAADIKDTEHRQDLRNASIEKEIDDVRKDVESNYVKKGTMAPVQYVVYGLVALILTSVVGAFIATIIHQTTFVSVIH